MAIRTVLVDDLDGSEAQNTVMFSVDDAAYEIDLSDENYRKFQECLAPYIEVARRAPGAPRKTSSKVAKATGTKWPKQQPPTHAEQLRAIREWARRQGHQISDRGRIPETILAEFNRAHSSKNTTSLFSHGS